MIPPSGHLEAVLVVHDLGDLLEGPVDLRIVGLVTKHMIIGHVVHDVGPEGDDQRISEKLVALLLIVILEDRMIDI